MNSALPRDAFIDEIFNEAIKNKNIYFLSADLGAKALDRFRKELPNQFLHLGICEQNMMDVAAGLAQNGKTVYTYAMSSFITARCYEQIKVALAAMNLPVTILSVGVGYSYDDAGPTHYTTEDISCFRALPNMEVLSPSDHLAVLETAKLSLFNPKLRYVRLDRKFLPDLHKDNEFVKNGMGEIKSGKKACIFTTGYMAHKTLEAAQKLKENYNIDLAVYDIFRIKPFNSSYLAEVLKNYDQVITIEEHALEGGLGSLILESMSDSRILKPVLRIGSPDRFFFENGTRNHVHELAGIDTSSIVEKVRNFLL